MSRLKLLDPAEALRFDQPPILIPQQQRHYFTLPSEGWPQFRKSVTQVGFTLQCGYFRLTQKFFRVAQFHQADIDFVTNLLALPQPVDLTTYSPHIAWEHQQVILRLLHIQPFEQYRPVFMGVVYSFFEQPLLPRKVLEEARRHLVRQRVEVPGYDVFLRIITDQYNVYGRKLSGQLDQFLTLTHRQVLDELVQQDETYQRSLVQQFKTVDQAQKPKAIKASLALFKKISNYFEQVEPAVRQLGFTDATLRHYAHRTTQDRTSHIREHDSKYLFLLCFLIHQYRVRQDTFVDMLLSCVKTADHATDRQRERLYCHQPSAP